MLVSKLIAQLQSYQQSAGDVPVMLTVTQHEQDGMPEESYNGDITGATLEQDHGSEALFIRISGDNEE